ncbi:MAG: hypothetical protein GQ527_02790, partial [Bacteroidales bacterium]|nr:hypothetical protein [Bacteroidales bacterium]
MRNKIYIFVLLVVALLFTTSCKRVVIKLNSIPENTPISQPIFVTGNFNNWDEGDEKYMMTLEADGYYYAVLPPAFGTIEYKFTRGDWTTVEKDICGDEIDNRIFSIAETDTVANTIESWNDLDPVNCSRLTILLDLLPTNTPNDEIIALASSVNSWDPDNASIFTKTASGDLYVTIDRPEGLEQLLCKITRGGLSTSESDEYGNELANRVLEFGKKDTIKLDVQGWIDLPVIQSKDVVIIINSLPVNTPKDEDIYMACNLNSWFPGDMNLKFQLNNQGHYYFETPRKNFTLNYKITRGDWDSEEVDENGWIIDNRTIDLQKADTIYIDIPRWKDMGQSGDEQVTIILNKLPESTPSSSNFYIAGTFNGWNPGRLRNKFKQDNYGTYYVNLPRKKGGFEMKITRGSWGKVQVNKDGSEAQNYIFSYHAND